MHRVLWVSLVLLVGGTRTTATEWPLLAGGLSGDFRMKALPGAPPINWRVEAVAESAEENRITLSAQAQGLVMRATVILPRDGSRGTWRILEGHLDISEWGRILKNSGFLSEMPGDLQLKGELQFAGKGTMLDSQFDGEVSAKLVGGSISSVAQEWSVQRLDFTAVLNLAEGASLIESLRLNSPQVEVQGFVLENLEVSAVGENLHHLRVNTSIVALFGGRVGVRPFTFDLLNPEMRVMAELRDVALDQLASLVPKALSAARGRLSGSWEIGWSAALGFQPGTGTLRIARDSSSTLLMAASPNFLTQHVPAKIEWVPAFFGPIGRWLAVNHPAYDTLRQIEMGKMALGVDSMEVSLYPDGRDGKVSARVAVTARPADSRAVEEVSFELNVTGPLKEVLLLGTDKRVKIGVKSK